MLVWLLSPQQTTKIRMFAVKSLLNEPRSKELFKNIIYINPQVCYNNIFLIKGIFTHVEEARLDRLDFDSRVG